MNALKNDSFVEENLGLVHLCANRFRGKGIEYDDLYGAGCVGLVKAASAFDRDRGVKFSTYAVPVILGEIRRLFRDGGTIKVSRSVRELGLKISRAKEHFVLMQGRDPTVSELADLIGSTAEDVAEALAVNLPPVSLTDNSDEGDEGQIDVVTPAPDLELVDLLSLRQALSALDEKDRKLIYFRYFKDMTQTEIAKLLDISQAQVSRLEKKILKKIGASFAPDR